MDSLWVVLTVLKSQHTLRLIVSTRLPPPPRVLHNKNPQLLLPVIFWFSFASANETACCIQLILFVSATPSRFSLRQIVINWLVFTWRREINKNSSITHFSFCRDLLKLSFVINSQWLGLRRVQEEVVVDHLKRRVWKWDNNYSPIYKKISSKDAIDDTVTCHWIFALLGGNRFAPVCVWFWPGQVSKVSFDAKVQFESGEW